MNDIEEDDSANDSQIEARVEYQDDSGDTEQPNLKTTETINFDKVEKNFRWLKKDWESPQTDFCVENDAVFDINTPLRYFKEYFTDHLLEEIILATNHSLFLKTETTKHNINLVEIKKFIALEIIIGTINFPRLKMYWAKSTEIQSFTNTMSRSRFHFIRNHLKFSLSSPPQSTDDKLWKIRSIINKINEKCQSIRKYENLCIDEMMIPFKGRTSIKQYMPKKPIRWGMKVFVVAGSDGVMHDFLIYQGKNTGITNA